MRVGRRILIGLAVGVTAVVGCRTAGPGMPILPEPTPPQPPPELPAARAGGLEPDLNSLPILDPKSTQLKTMAPVPTGYLGLTEEACRREAAARATASELLLNENQVPVTAGESILPPAAGVLLFEVRALVAEEARNRAAAQALEQYFQLADAEGRAELVRSSLPVLDQLRATVTKARADGLRVPVEPEELDRQRGTLLALIGQADLAAKLLDLDLKRRLSVPAKAETRLKPVGPFPMNAEPVAVEAAVQVALERRADLRMLRAVYLQLTPDLLPTARDVIRHAAEAGGLIGPNGMVPAPPVRTIVNVVAGRRNDNAANPIVVAEMAVRRQQLFDLIAERERRAADQVRAAAYSLDAQTKQVALARWRAEQLLAKAADAKDKGPLVEPPAILEAYRARAEVIAAVMTWHQARVKLLAAQGLLSEGATNPAK